MKIGDEFILKSLEWYKNNYAIKFDYRKTMKNIHFYIQYINHKEKYIISNNNQKFLFGEIILRKEIIKNLLD